MLYLKDCQSFCRILKKGLDKEKDKFRDSIENDLRVNPKVGVDEIN